jgi:uncharacterized Tic20 family protein
MNETQLPPPQSPAPGSSVSSEIRNWSVLCHASALSGLFFHVLGFLLGPLIVWLIKRDSSSEIDVNGKESLNFQISMLIYHIIALVLCFVLIGIPILIALYIADIVFVIIASVKTSNGESYRYPLTIRFIS